ncbi:hypothetical protein [Polaribacter glomeratus]|uniref:Uncharacterized protein n=1 Tax=Polaribacter glomeratus TaxID=102 RepID=A0A2S7WYB5_9FLAO|nr:hypothetical protein [Polaribacter glomeratus]PQJ82577.1 hypothetical protein BTO16_08315 [Polaribacter glomeratus]TXD64967.1 hypothetical protein ESX12_12555 [Polaribacter glomeratus]
MKPLNKISMFLCFLVLTSCYESLDLNQLDDHVSKPVLTSSLTYFTLVSAQFFDSNGIQQNSISDSTQFKGFENSYIRDNLVKIDFNAEIKNEFDREVSLQVDFLNNSNNVVYSFTTILVEKEDLNFKFLEEIEIASHPTILNTTKVRISTSIENTGTQMNPNDTRELVFKSSVTLFIESSI